MKKIILSFLVPAHNEEKLIGNTLKNLLKLPYEQYEILVGIDGCNDKTESIVKQLSRKNRKIRYFTTHTRSGKPEVIEFLSKQAKGDLWIIHDADWYFKVKNKKSLQDLLKLFENDKVGGIAESFPIQYPLRKNAQILERGVMIQNKIWIDYMKSKGNKFNEQWIEANQKYPLLVNIFRKELYTKNLTLGDDFERFFYIYACGKKVLTTNDESFPRMISVGENYSFFGLVKQKERTAMARKQLKLEKNGLELNNRDFYSYVIKKFLRMKIKDVFAFSIVNLAFLIGTVKSLFKKNISTRDGWNMRLKR